jgi:hypothetical protein
VRDLGIATLAGLILASMGPFGTYLAGPFETRIAYWVGLLWSCAQWVAALLRIPAAVALGGAFALAALPMSAITSFVATWVWGAEALLCLQMQDHYVSVHWTSGTDLLLLRLRDAIEEADGGEGLQVHRSWWGGALSCSSGAARGLTAHAPARKWNRRSSVA